LQTSKSQHKQTIPFTFSSIPKFQLIFPCPSAYPNDLGFFYAALLKFIQAIYACFRQPGAEALAAFGSRALCLHGI